MSTKVLYVGEGAIRTVIGIMGIESITYTSELPPEMDSLPLIKALESDKTITVEHIPSYYAIFSFPQPDELNQYDVLVLSDVGFYSLARYEGDKKGPDRVKGIREFIKKGGGIAFCGGELSYSGRRAAAKWWRTPLAEALPIEILPIDDLMWSSEGFTLKPTQPEHELLKGIPWKTMPKLYGYNKVINTKKGANVLAKIGYDGEEKDIGMAEWTYGKGRVFAFTSDPVPEWGKRFIEWEPYPKFWTRVIKWLAKGI